MKSRTRLAAAILATVLVFGSTPQPANAWVCQLICGVEAAACVAAGFGTSFCQGWFEGCLAGCASPL